MTKKEISRDLQPATALWKQYRPANAPYAFKAGDAAAARRWQGRTRRALAHQIGLDVITGAPARARVLENVDRGSFMRQKILLRTGPNTLMPVYLLLPKEAKRPLPVVLAFNGHCYGVKDIVGLWENGQERETPDGYQKDFAVALCRAGFAVAAPEISCFGERQTDFSHLNRSIGQPIPNSCAHTAMLALHLGISALGLRIHDGMRLLDYLETRKDLDTTRVGAMGISGGGMHTFFSTCLDERIRACVVSGYYSSFRESILSVAHCTCNFVPGLAEFGEMSDLVGLIAPRPMLVESGTFDPIFPIQAVRQGVARARTVYRIFNVAGQPDTDYFEGRHRINGPKAYEFLKRALASART